MSDPAEKFAPHEEAERETGPGACELPGPLLGAGGDPTLATGQRRAIGYGRVSTREQAENGASLLHQRHQVRTTCDLREWQLVEWFQDPGVSGKDMRRPQLQKALKMLKAGEAEILVAAKLDRLSRSTLDFALLVERSKKEGWQLLLLDINLDTTTPYGEAMAGMAAVFAQLERRMIGQRTKDGLATKRATGTLKGPIGRPSTLPELVRERIHRERGEGRTLQAIADGLNEDQVPTAQGGRKWWPQSVDAVLNPGRSRAARTG